MNTLFVFPLIIAGWQWVAIALVVLLLFGGRKIPELMRGLGKGMKEFKKGMKEAEAEVDEIQKELDKVDEQDQPQK